MPVFQGVRSVVRRLKEEARAAMSIAGLLLRGHTAAIALSAATQNAARRDHSRGWVARPKSFEGRDSAARPFEDSGLQQSAWHSDVDDMHAAEPLLRRRIGEPFFQSDESGGMIGPDGWPQRLAGIAVQP
jgi:hypothetical protein